MRAGLFSLGAGLFSLGDKVLPCEGTLCHAARHYGETDPMSGLYPSVIPSSVTPNLAANGALDCRIEDTGGGDRSTERSRETLSVAYAGHGWRG